MQNGSYIYSHRALKFNGVITNPQIQFQCHGMYTAVWQFPY